MEEQLANGLNELAFLCKGAGRGPCVPPRIDIFAVSFQSSGSGHSQRTLGGSGDKAVNSRSWFKSGDLHTPTCTHIGSAATASRQGPLQQQLAGSPRSPAKAS